LGWEKIDFHSRASAEKFPWGPMKKPRPKNSNNKPPSTLTVSG